jgi:tetratricopeptide (TPR) repeat protein
MFKLGLLSQARFDFDLIIDFFPKEKILKFNLALTLLQLGRYLEAISTLEPLINIF